MTKSYLRGHEITCREGVWYYSDTNTPTEGNDKACGYCRRASTVEGHDACLGTLEGVMNACCGHGVDKAYVMFNNGLIIRGEVEYENM